MTRTLSTATLTSILALGLALTPITLKPVGLSTVPVPIPLMAYGNDGGSHGGGGDGGPGGGGGGGHGGGGHDGSSNGGSGGGADDHDGSGLGGSGQGSGGPGLDDRERFFGRPDDSGLNQARIREGDDQTRIRVRNAAAAEDFLHALLHGDETAGARDAVVGEDTPRFRLRDDETGDRLGDGHHDQELVHFGLIDEDKEVRVPGGQTGDDLAGGPAASQGVIDEGGSRIVLAEKGAPVDAESARVSDDPILVRVQNGAVGARAGSGETGPVLVRLGIGRNGNAVAARLTDEQSRVLVQRGWRLDSLDTDRNGTINTSDLGF